METLCNVPSDQWTLDPSDLAQHLASSFRLERATLTPATRLIEDLGLDSLAVAEIAILLGELGFEIPAERVHGIHTLDDLCHAARRLEP